MAGGVPIFCDSSEKAITVYTSLVGLPPVYLYRDGDTVAIASDLNSLADVPGVALRLDPTAVQELGTIGHPVEHRTLFENLHLVGSGGRLRVTSNGAATFDTTWALPPASPTSWQDFIEAQIAAFTESMRRMDVTSSFLSLTAGLDTRAVLATLASHDRLITTVTMTGRKRSLDARTAARLSQEYGVEHRPIVFDDSFVSRLPEFLEKASRLSGGLSSLDQAPEVYLYDQLGGDFAARLSGNLGNQVGRGGTEGVSTRGAHLRILADELRASGALESTTRHWLLEHLDTDEHSTLQYILREEIPFTLASNFPIGNHYATQQTPYADRTLIETLALRPESRGSAPSGSMLWMRLRDLRHRFFGEPEKYSFQRTLLNRDGGFAARYPINWGWRAAGGISPRGTALGFATLLGMYARAKGLDGGILARPLALSGFPALHDFREARRWLRQHLRDYTWDVLTTESVKHLFDQQTLHPVLESHFSGSADHYDTVTFALDVALAHKCFCSSHR